MARVPALGLIFGLFTAVSPPKARRRQRRPGQIAGSRFHAPQNPLNHAGERAKDKKGKDQVGRPVEEIDDERDGPARGGDPKRDGRCVRYPRHLAPLFAGRAAGRK